MQSPTKHWHTPAGIVSAGNRENTSSGGMKLQDPLAHSSRGPQVSLTVRSTSDEYCREPPRSAQLLSYCISSLVCLHTTQRREERKNAWSENQLRYRASGDKTEHRLNRLSRLDLGRPLVIHLQSHEKREKEKRRKSKQETRKRFVPIRFSLDENLPRCNPDGTLETRVTGSPRFLWIFTDHVDAHPFCSLDIRPTPRLCNFSNYCS